MTAAEDHLCPKTGLYLVSAQGQRAYRVAKDTYVRRDGVLGVRSNTIVGSIGGDVLDTRGRFDTLGRTVYFADSPETAFAEVLAPFRRERAALAPDAAAAGMDLDEYVEAVTTEAEARGMDAPWAVGGDWQMERSLYRVRMPLQGWWVDIEHYTSLATISRNMTSALLDLGLSTATRADVLGERREVTTAIASAVRGLELADGSRPLGIQWRSKCGYGSCWAWWHRRADDGLLASDDDPSLEASDNVDGKALREVANLFGLPVLPGRPAF